MTLQNDPQFLELKDLLNKGSSDQDRILLLMEEALKKRREIKTRRPLKAKK